MRASVLSILLAMLAATGVWAEKRVALVIGNDSHSEFRRLNNAGRDASALAAKLEALGFETTLKLNATKVSLDSALDNLAADLTTSDVGLV